MNGLFLALPSTCRQTHPQTKIVWKSFYVPGSPRFACCPFPRERINGEGPTHICFRSRLLRSYFAGAGCMLFTAQRGEATVSVPIADTYAARGCTGISGTLFRVFLAKAGMMRVFCMLTVSTDACSYIICGTGLFFYVSSTLWSFFFLVYPPSSLTLLPVLTSSSRKNGCFRHARLESHWLSPQLFAGPLSQLQILLLLKHR